MQRTHHLETLDRGIGRLQHLEAPDRPGQLLQLAVVGFDDVVQVFDLPMQRLRRAPAFLLQPGQGSAVGWRLVGVDGPGFSQSFSPFSALPRKRVAAVVLRVGER